MKAEESNYLYGSRIEYDSEYAKHPETEHEFVDIFHAVLIGGGAGSRQKTHYSVSYEGVDAATCIEYSSIARDLTQIRFDESVVRVEYATNVHEEGDEEYNVLLQELPQRKIPSDKQLRRTEYHVVKNGATYSGTVDAPDCTNENGWSRRVMTPYDYRQLGTLLSEVYVVQLAEQREHAILSEYHN